ncbi:MAG TPA: HAD family phosphatase [Firmicutes bacterium]|nr:HAD family phosphatase [Bacillota bacterium]
MPQPEPTMAVLFDMDGVLVLSNPAHQAAWAEFAQERLGLTITKEMFYRRISGRKNEEALEELFPNQFTAEELTRLSEEKEQYYREHYGPTLEPVPGVVELIEQLRRQNVRLAVATSAISQNVSLVLARFGIGDAFPIIVTATDVIKAKPDPAIYLLAAEKCDMPPERCVVLEDAVAGVQAAKRANMRCLAVTTSHTTEELLSAGADAVYPDFTAVNTQTLRNLLYGEING